MQRVENLKGMEWGMSTDLMKVFNMILTTAVRARVKPKDMPSTLVTAIVHMRSLPVLLTCLVVRGGCRTMRCAVYLLRYAIQCSDSSRQGLSDHSCYH